jgi:para-nitrobenzyl esterase
MKTLNRKFLLVVLLLSLVTMACASGRARATVSASTPLPGMVMTQFGPVQGFQQGRTAVFFGIPYAAPPVGELRWKPPAAPRAWTETLQANELAPICPQMDEDQIVGDEDCLYLNIWTPAEATPESRLPVMVYIHGGGNVQGSAAKEVGSVLLYDGQSLSEGGNVVVVTMQYRIGALGYFVDPGLEVESEQGVSGNYGLLDQIAVLQWVQQNITNFGGDSERVMLFGESGGAVNTCMMLVSPLASGLFTRALMQSGACVAKTRDVRLQEGEDFINATGCQSEPDTVACLRGLGSNQIVAAVDTTPIKGGIVTMAFGPYVDGYVLPEAPLAALEAGRFNQVPFIVGSNADEMLPLAIPMTQAMYEAAVHKSLDFLQPGLAEEALALYAVGDGPGEFESPRHAFAALVSDAQFTCNARGIAQAASQNEIPVYRYFFSQVLDAPLYRQLGAYHGLELLFVFQHLPEMEKYDPTSADLALQSAMLGYWTRFAATGDPNDASAVQWPLYDAEQDTYLELGATIQAGVDLRKAQCDFWELITEIRQAGFPP